MENVCTVTQIRLGEGGGGGGDTMGGGGGVGEPRTGNAGSQTQANMVDVINYLRHAPELRLPRCWPEDW